jgi:glycerophosphoryl diester phosphodiesterase
MIVPRAPDGASLAPTDLIARAHRAGLAINAWTFRPENFFLPAQLRAGVEPAAHGDLAAELRQHFALGLDGAFCDFPAMAVAARDGA